MRYKSFLAAVLLALSLSHLLPSMSEAAEPRTVTLAVENMTCSLCPLTVRMALEKVPGVIKAASDYRTKTATVTFDPEKTNVQALTDATFDAGYPSALKK